uniref:polymeric immunoglobulin receptor-like isoform X1 n=1 Tax=Geotrypetes seraphini TaxID=260995 RepID=UPI001458FE4C|nr:polymeric immunoglobulin receptor-like isoform X1 [Geotrypetes seraphini]
MYWKVPESAMPLLALILVAIVSAQDPRYEVFQPELVSAVVGESIILPCSFSYPQEIEPIWKVRVYWRINNFHGSYIFKDTNDFVHPDYAERLSLHGLPTREKTASLRIEDLRESDSNRYFCRVVLTMNDEVTEEIQCIHGTELRVSVSAPNSSYELFQPKSVSAVAGESVLLSCFFSNHRMLDPIWELKVFWRINSSDGDYIYRDKEGFTHPDYTGRISLHGALWTMKRASITIKQLRENDTNRYFCGVESTNEGKSEQWQSIGGTELRVSDSARKPGYQVFQPELLSAVAGESVILPCYFTYPQEIRSIRNLNVSWRINHFNGDFIYNYSEKFTHQNYKGRISLAGYPWGDKTASIRIRDLRKNDGNRYYCRLQLMKNDGAIEEVQSVNGTELRVTDSAQKPGYQVFQPELVSAAVGESVILPCSFTYPQEIEPVWDVRVSWRINAFLGDYIYKFIPSFTHQNYRRRISLSGFPWGNKTASIRINDLRKSDSNRYYCRIKLMKNDGATEEVQSVNGTELRVTDKQINNPVTFSPRTAVAPTVDKENRKRNPNPDVEEEGKTETVNPGGDYGNIANY